MAKDLTLFVLGLLGLVLHCLVKINSLKNTKLPDGKMYDFNIKEYLSREWASMSISFIVVVVCIMCKHEVQQLEAAGKWLGLGFVGLGYMSQSVLVAFMGRFQTALGVKDITSTVLILFSASVLCLAPSCKSLKVASHTTRDSVVIKVHDSAVVRYKDSTVLITKVKDTVIGIPGAHAGVTVKQSSTVDTIVKLGKLRISRTVDDGVEHIDCDADSLTIAVADLRTVIEYKDRRIDSLTSAVRSVSTAHQEVTVKEVKKSWLARTWDSVKNVFAVWGLIILIILAIRFILKLKKV